MFRSLRLFLTGPSDETRPNAGEYEPLSVGDDASSHRDSMKDLRHEPKVYFAFWVLGAGVLLSWNALLCTIPLLISFFPPDSTVRSSLASYISSSYCFGNLFFLGLAQRNVGKSSPSKRIHWSLILLLITSLILSFPLLPMVLPNLSPSTLFPVLMGTTTILSISTAYLQSGVFALASLWGSKEILGVMSGQGGIAVLVSLVQLVLAMISSSHQQTTLPGDGDEQVTKASTLAGVGLWALGSIGSLACLVAHRYLLSHSEYTSISTSTNTNGNADYDGEEKKGLTYKVFKKNMLLMIAVAWVFIVTLSIFPPVTTTILSTHQPTPRLLQPDIFIPLHFLIFNVGDYIGRTYLPSIHFMFTTSPPRILLLSLSRTLFIPLLFLCNTTPRSSPPIFNSDLIYLLVILTLGMSNGYIGSLCMIVASSPEFNKRIEEDERDVAGTLASFCLVAGLAIGSAASFGVSAWIE
ncbi:uncharacterized protein IL334_003880 [Kwoniella shivajii]|uniref:Solute carrier family 29 (Equilibrative nucleoside transporter), member 1/2/3 n=1 Tax=Kwoniella shivajii TaxID=564305 RepID=A0ABZ1CZ65_9TREE|nr:hypothetical protein IL334_003880 [Kwoniella shivajii]